MSEQSPHANLNQYLYDDFLNKYEALKKLINIIPLPGHLKAIISKEFDNGYLWMKEGFHILNIMAQQAEQVPHPLPSVQEHVVDDVPPLGITEDDAA